MIGLGAAAFAVGQTYVTLSFRSGFAAGWAMNAPMLGGSKRRRGERGRQEPTLEVSGMEAAGGGYGDEGGDYRRDTASYGQGDDYDRDDVFTPARPVHPTAAETTAVYEPQPIPDDTGSYGVYGDTGYHQGSPHDQYAATAQGTDQSYAYDYSDYGQQQGYDAADQQQYAAYSDPYIGNPNYGATSYDTGYGDQQYYGQQQGYGQDQYSRHLRRREPARRCVGPAAAHRRVRAGAAAGAAVPVPGQRAAGAGQRLRRAVPFLKPESRRGRWAHWEPRNPGPSTTSPATSAPDMPHARQSAAGVRPAADGEQAGHTRAVGRVQQPPVGRRQRLQPAPPRPPRRSPRRCRPECAPRARGDGRAGRVWRVRRR